MNTRIAFCIYFLLPTTLLFGQKGKTDSQPSVFKNDILFTEVNPLHPFGIFMQSAPFYIGSFNEASHEIKVSYGMANIWGPQATMYYPQDLPSVFREEVNDLYVTNRPGFFESINLPTRQKTFSTDGILQNMTVSYIWQLKKRGTFIFNLNTHLLSGGNSPLHYPASDKLIEVIHSAIGSEDNFGRKVYPFNRAHISFEDEDGNNIRVSKGAGFLGTLDTHYYFPLYMKNNRSSYYSLQMGGHIAIPLNNYYPKVSGGISTTFLYRKKITKTFSTDVSLNGLLTHNSLLSLNTNTTNITDRNLRMNAKFYLGFNFYKPSKGRTFYLGLLNNYQDAFLEGNIFSSSQDEYKDLGISFLGAGDTWEGVTIEESFNQNKLTPASMYFFSITTYLVIGHKTPRGDFSITIGEDLQVVNNAPDIQYGVSYAFNLSYPAK